MDIIDLHFLVHSLFDLLALSLAGLTAFMLHRRYLRMDLEHMAARLNPWYFVALASGSMIGAWVFGTWNMMLSSTPGWGRSILGSLFGAILMVEIYKARYRIKGSTGWFYALPFCTLVIIGRIGCFLSGLSDHTHGIPTSLPWGHDYGDGISRHPVQLYEALLMAVFLIYGLLQLKYRQTLFVRTGFYQMTGFYAAQRFCLEFIKPYAPLAGSLNLFQWLCLILVGYSLVMWFWASGDA